MVAKGARDRRSSSSTTAMTNTSSATSKRRLTSATQEKKKIAKPIGICGFCLGDNEKNANGCPEEMIHCAECGNSGHPSCLQYSERLVKKIRTIHWQCIDCKRCIVCNKSDDSLLFCDFCDAGIHPKCCDPPLHNIPKGDFACHLCREEFADELNTSPKKSFVKTLSSSSIRSRRSQNANESNEEETSAVISRPVAQLIDGMSNFFLPNKQKINTIRQQSVQKAMKYLREKKSNKLLKRLQASESKASKENTEIKHQLIAKSILSTSKNQRIRKKPFNFTDELSSSPQTSTPLITRQSTSKKPPMIEPITPPARHSRRSDTQPIDEPTKTKQRKHSANSISPISSTSSLNKKRSRNESSPAKKTMIKLNSKKRKEGKSEEEQTDDEQNDEKKSSTNNKRKLHLDLSKYKNVPAFINDSLPDNINENDIHLFLDARKNSTKLINECSEKYHHSSESLEDDTTNTRWPPYIVFGSDLIKTWYSSSYPQEYARVPRLFICEFCLKYMKCEQVYDRHRKTCKAFHPPANEIYHKDDLSVFEVDGNINRIYCQNLCLLAKLFLDHKTLYYDVEPFLFYVLTRNDSSGCHFLGYFSKEKHCPQKYNLSCITVLPNCQRRGYGRFLIELSYLLSKKEGQVGTPERPLSTLGAQTYEAYWKLKIVEQLLNYYNENQPKTMIKSIMNDTGMATDDIVETLQNLGVLTMKSNGKPVITIDVTQLEVILRNERVKHAHWVTLDGEYLRFTPVLTPHLLINEERAVEKEMKEIQIVFKEIGRDAAEAAAASAATETTDGSNGTEVVRYIRRRKFGQKRRSIYVKRRIPVANNKGNKNDSMITHEDSSTQDTITNDDDDHSQEYISRRRISTIDESNKEEEKEPENEKVVEVTKPPSPILSLSKTSSKPPALKQLKLDQFLKGPRPSIADALSSLNEPSKVNHAKTVSSPEYQSEKINGEEKKFIDYPPVQNEVRRINRNTRLHSESDHLPTANGSSNENAEKLDDTLTDIQTESLTKPKSPHEISIQRTASISEPINGATNDQISLSRQTSITSSIPPETPSSLLSDILANRSLSSSSSSTFGTDDERRIARIESQLKTTAANVVVQENLIEQEEISSVNTFAATIKPVETPDDEMPPSLISPTSMIISQSNHYNYSSRNNQQANPPMNNFNPASNLPYNYGATSFPYGYPTVPPAIDVPPFYYPNTNYMPYYPTPAAPYPTAPPPTSSMYPPGPMYTNTTDPPGIYYQSNGLHPMTYASNGPSPYVYPTAQPSSTASTTHRH